MVGRQHPVPDWYAVLKIILSPLLNSRMPRHLGLVLVPVLLVTVERF